MIRVQNRGSKKRREIEREWECTKFSAFSGFTIVRCLADDGEILFEFFLLFVIAIVASTNDTLEPYKHTNRQVGKALSWVVYRAFSGNIWRVVSFWLKF